MSQRPLPPHYSEPPAPDPDLEYWPYRESDGTWLGFCLICGTSGAIVGGAIIALIFWLS